MFPLSTVWSLNWRCSDKDSDKDSTDKMDADREARSPAPPLKRIVTTGMATTPYGINAGPRLPVQLQPVPKPKASIAPPWPVQPQPVPKSVVGTQKMSAATQTLHSHPDISAATHNNNR